MDGGQVPVEFRDFVTGDALVVGFDLDLTLVDSTPGIVTTMQAALADFGVEVSREQVWPTIGLHLSEVIAELAAGTDTEAAVRRYRELYLDLGVPGSTVLPGAAEAVAAVHEQGGRALVVSAKADFAVHAMLAEVGLDALVDEAVGGLFGAQKGHYLREMGATIYVGDHPGDIEAARVAGALAVAVATGPHSASALAEYGPDVLLTDLEAFPGWLRGLGSGLRDGPRR